MADIATDIVQEVDIHSQRGQEIMQKNDIQATPALLLLDCTDTVIDAEYISTD